MVKYLSLLFLPVLVLTGCDANDEGPDAEIAVQDLVVGTGTEAAEGYFVSFRYAGFLADSTSFGEDSLELAVGDGSVIPGLDQGLRGMRQGGRRRITVPPNLAFGRRGTSVIPPNATLVLDVEMKRVGGSNGILVEEIKAGTGAEATAGATAEVSFTGTLIDGTVFDDGVFAFRLGRNEVIEGFDRGVLGMKAGGQRRITIPPSLGYGGRQNGSIPAFSTLIFDVTLVSVQP